MARLELSRSLAAKEQQRTQEITHCWRAGTMAMRSSLVSANLSFHCQNWQRCLSLLKPVRDKLLQIQSSASESHADMLKLIEFNILVCENRLQDRPISDLIEQTLALLPSAIANNSQTLTPDRAILYLNAAHFLRLAGHFNVAVSLLYKALSCLRSAKTPVSPYLPLLAVFKISTLCASAPVAFVSKAEMEQMLTDCIEVLDSSPNPFAATPAPAANLLIPPPQPSPSPLAPYIETLYSLHRSMLLCALAQIRGDVGSMYRFYADYGAVVEGKLGSVQGRGVGSLEVKTEEEIMLLRLLGEVREVEGEEGKVSLRIDTKHYWLWYVCHAQVYSDTLDPALPRRLQAVEGDGGLNRLAVWCGSARARGRGSRARALLYHERALQAYLASPTLTDPPLPPLCLLHNLGVAALQVGAREATTRTKAAGAEPVGKGAGGLLEVGFLALLGYLGHLPLPYPHTALFRLGEGLMQMYARAKADALADGKKTRGMRAKVVGVRPGVASLVLEDRRSAQQQLLVQEAHQRMRSRLLATAEACGLPLPAVLEDVSLDVAVHYLTRAVGKLGLGLAGDGGRKMLRSALLLLCYAHCELASAHLAWSFARALVRMGVDNLSLLDRQLVARVYCEAGSVRDAHHFLSLPPPPAPVPPPAPSPAVSVALEGGGEGRYAVDGGEASAGRLADVFNRVSLDLMLGRRVGEGVKQGVGLDGSIRVGTQWLLLTCPVKK